MIIPDTSELFNRRSEKPLETCLSCRKILEEEISPEVSAILKSDFFNTRVARDFGLVGGEDILIRLNTEQLKVTVKGRFQIYYLKSTEDVAHLNKRIIDKANDVYQRHHSHHEESHSTPAPTIAASRITPFTPGSPARENPLLNETKEELAKAQKQVRAYEAQIAEISTLKGNLIGAANEKRLLEERAKDIAAKLDASIAEKAETERKAEELTILADDLGRQVEKVKLDHTTGIAELNDEVKRLKGKLVDAQLNASAIQGDLDSQKEQDAAAITKLQKKIDAKVEEIAEKTESYKDLITEMQKSFAQLQKEAEANVAKSIALEQTIAKLQAEREETQKQIQDLQTTTAALRGAIDGLEASAIEADETLIVQKKNAAAALAAKDAEIVDLLLALRKAEDAKQAALQAQADGAKANIDALGQQIKLKDDESRKQVQALQDKIAAANGEIEKLEDQLNTTKKAQAELEIKNDALAGLAQNAISQMDELTGLMEQKDAVHTQQANDLKGKLHAEQENLKKAQAQNENLEKKLDTAETALETEKVTLQGCVDAAKAEVASLTDELQQVKDEDTQKVQALQGKLHVEEANLKAVQAEIADIKYSLGVSEQSNGNLKTANTNLQIDNAKLQTEIENGKELIESLKQEMEQEESAQFKLMEEMVAGAVALEAKAKADIVSLEEQLQAAEKAKIELQAQKEKLSEKVALAKEEMDALEQKRHRDEADLANAFQELSNKLKVAQENEKRAQEQLQAAEKAKEQIHQDHIYRLQNAETGLADARTKLGMAADGLRKGMIKQTSLQEALEAAQAQAKEADAVARRKIDELQVTLKDREKALNVAIGTAQLASDHFLKDAQMHLDLNGRLRALKGERDALYSIADEALQLLDEAYPARTTPRNTPSTPESQKAFHNALMKDIAVAELFSPTATPQILKSVEPSTPESQKAFHDALMKDIAVAELFSPTATPQIVKSVEPSTPESQKALQQLLDTQIDDNSPLRSSNNFYATPRVLKFDQPSTPDSQRALQMVLEAEIAESPNSTTLSPPGSQPSTPIAKMVSDSTLSQLSDDASTVLYDSFTEKCDDIVNAVVNNNRDTNQKTKIRINDRHVREAIKANLDLIANLKVDTTGQASMPKAKGTNRLFATGIAKATNMIKTNQSVRPGTTPEQNWALKYDGFFDFVKELRTRVTELHSQLSPNKVDREIATFRSDDHSLEENFTAFFEFLGTNSRRYLNWAAELCALEHLDEKLSNERRLSTSFGNPGSPGKENPQYINWKGLRETLVKLKELVEIVG